MRPALRFLIWLCGLAAGLIAAAAALLGQLGRWSTYWDLLNHLAPFWMAFGLVGALLCLLAASGPARWAATAGVIAVVVAGLQVGAPLARGTGQTLAGWRIPASAPRLKLIQFSFFHGNPTPQAAVDWLISQQPDVIVLEEGEGLQGPARDRLLAAFPYRSSHNDFILSRLPILDSGRFETEPRATSMYFNGGFVRLQGPGGPFILTNVHFTWPWPVRFQDRQRREFARYVQTLPADTTIVAGDLNSTPWSFALARLGRQMGLSLVTNTVLTFPARTYHGDGLMNRARALPGIFAFAPIDHVFAGRAWRAVSVRRGPKIGSDHYPVVAVLARVG